MAKTRYESKKPAHQVKPNHSQPPIGSVAVFEWETFSPLADFSDKSLSEVFKRISRDIIERPYHYDAHRAFDAQGANKKYNFTSADNSKPPEKVQGVAVYKQNHGTGHAIRQMIYTDALIDKIAQDGNPKGQAIAQKINNNPEIKSILKIAAYCKRIGRTFDHEHDNHLPGQPTIYSKRSADMFAQMATELGYSKDLIDIVRDGMLEPTSKDPAVLNSYKSVGGIDGKDLRYFSENILMSAHMADLSRIFKVATKYLETSLKFYFGPEQLKTAAKELTEMGCTANAMTGNGVAVQEEGIKHQQKSIDGKKLVEVVNNIDKTIEELSKLKLGAPLEAVVAPVKPVAQAQQVPVTPNPPSKAGVIPFRVDFLKVENGKKTPVTDEEQARVILAEVDRLHKLGAKTVGITYSANQGQTDKILDVYAKGQWKTGTSGSNQASVMNEVEKLLGTPNYKHLHNVFRIIPITTMKYNPKAMAADDASVKKSLDNANQFMANGGVLLGWQNQATKTGNLAIGGGVAAGVQPAGQKQMIDQWVKEKLTSSPVLQQPHANKPQQSTKPSVNETHKETHKETPKPSVAIENKYAYKAFNPEAGRSHLFSASISTASVADDFKSRYKAMHGDHLKTKILEDLKEKIQNTSSKAELGELKTKLMTSPEYDVLKTGQGLFTRITGIKTSSVVALEDMLKQKEESFDKPSFKA